MDQLLAVYMGDLPSLDNLLNRGQTVSQLHISLNPDELMCSHRGVGFAKIPYRNCDHWKCTKKIS